MGKMAYQSLRLEYLQIPPVSRAYTTACVLKKKKKKKEYAKIFKILGFRNKLLRPEYLWDLGDYLPIHSDLHFPP